MKKSVSFVYYLGRRETKPTIQYRGRLMSLLTRPELLKEAKIDYYKRYSENIKIKCSFCVRKTKRAKTFHSLKSLSWHIAHFHSNEVGFPFICEQIQEVLKIIALAKEWRILP